MNTNTAPMTTAELIQRAKAAAAAKAEREKQERAAAEAARLEKQADKATKPAEKPAEKPAAAFTDPYAAHIPAGLDALDALSAVNAWNDCARLKTELETIAGSEEAQAGEEGALIELAEVAAELEEVESTIAGLNVPEAFIRETLKAQDASHATMRGPLSPDSLGQSHLAGHPFAGEWRTMTTAALDALLVVRVSLFAGKLNQLNPEKFAAALTAAGWNCTGTEAVRFPHRAAIAANPYLRSFKPDEKSDSFYTVVSFPKAGMTPEQAVKEENREPMPVKAIDSLLIRGLLSGWIAPQWGEIHSAIDAEKQPARRGRKPGSKNGTGSKAKKTGPSLSALSGLL